MGEHTRTSYTSEMASLTLTDVEKIYPGGAHAVRGCALEIADGEFLVLVGPSGCGKSTLLRMIAGLEDITSGTISIGDRVVNAVQPKDRDIAMVFQNYALYPHKTARANLEFALKLRKIPRAERQGTNHGSRPPTRHRGTARPPTRPDVRRPAATRRPRARPGPESRGVPLR